MLSIAAIAGSNGYYENNPEKNYYLDDAMQSFFTGTGAKNLGLYGERVSIEQQEALTKGILPTGETLKIFNPGKHRSGYDLTFSAPKSVSVLSLVTGDSRLISSHKKAVELTLQEIENLASVRSRQGGQYTMVPTNNLVVACHNHDTSRECDPQLHTHALIFNITQNTDGKWQALSTDFIHKTGFIENVYANQLALGNIYRQILRNEVEALGFNTTNTGKIGLWEIEGVPTMEFSKRRQQIISLAGEDASHKEKDKITLATRKIKTPTDKEQLIKTWQNTLNQTGFNKDKFYQGVNINDKNIKLSDTQLINYRAVKQAIQLLSDEKIQITYQDLFNAAMLSSAKNPGVIQEIKQSIDKTIIENTIIPIDREKAVFVSQINLNREKT